MDSINQFFQSVFQMALCASPFIVVGAIIGGVILYNSHSKRQRRERWASALQVVSGLNMSALDSIPMSDQVPHILFATNMADFAQSLRELSKANPEVLEQKAFDKFGRALQVYRQEAAFGMLPAPELDQLRSNELQRIDALGLAATDVAKAAEAGDGNALRQHVVEASRALAAAYGGHVIFFQRLADEGVAFPIQPPAAVRTAPASMTYATSPELVPVQILQQIPEDKQALFLMQYNSVKKTPSTAVLFAVLLGGVGAHKFYLGQIGQGILYLLFSWTWIPLILGLIEAFTIGGYVNRHNAQKAMEIAAMFKASA